MQQFDVRQEKKPVWTLSAHSPGQGANGMSLSSQCPGCLVTVSSDQTLKVWDVLSGKPECVLEKSMGMGKLHALGACPDAPFVVCAGGDLPRDNLRVWDVRESTQGKQT